MSPEMPYPTQKIRLPVPESNLRLLNDQEKSSALKKVPAPSFGSLNKHFLYYPLTGRMQEVIKETFRKLEGKVYKKKDTLIRIIYPQNYPLEKRAPKTLIKQLLLDSRSFEAQGLLSTAEKAWKGGVFLVEALTKVGESIESLRKTMSPSKGMACRLLSIVARFISICAKDGFSMVDTLALIADIYSVKEDFSPEGVEDLALSTLLDFLPKKLKLIALTMLTIQRREGSFHTSILQHIADLVVKVADFILETDKIPGVLKSLITNLKTLVHMYSTHGLMNEMASIIREYKKKPIILGDNMFWMRMEVVEAKLRLDVSTDSVGAALLELARTSPSVRVRLEAFNRLVKLKNNLKNSGRIEPSCFIFDGPPGTFKSVTLSKLLKVLGKSVYVHHVKSLMDGKDFYDTYDGEEVFYMDDVGQQGKSQWRNLINWVSCIPLPLDCAAADLKNTKLFTSEIILLTTNQFMDLHGFTAQDGIAEPEALFRRAFVFDWAQVKLNEQGSISGTVTLKKFDIKTKKWKEFSHPKLSGSLQISSELELLAWLASWVHSINEWKKGCQIKNDLTEEFISSVQRQVVKLDFNAQADLDETSLVKFVYPSGNRERSRREEVEWNDMRERIIPLPEGKMGYKIDVDPILVTEGYFGWIDHLLLPTEDPNTFYFYSLDREWTIWDHLKAIGTFLGDLMVSISKALVSMLLTIATDPLAITGLILGLSYLAVIYMLQNSVSFTDEAETHSLQNYVNGDWDALRPKLSTKTSSQVSSLSNSNSYFCKIDNYKVCAMCFDKYILIPAHAVSSLRRDVTVSLLRAHTNTALLESVKCEVVYRSEHDDLVMLKLPSSNPLTFKDVNFGSGFSDEGTFLVTPIGAIEMQNIRAVDSLGSIPYTVKGEISFSNELTPANRELYTVHFKGLCGSVITTASGFVKGMHVAGSDQRGLGVSILWSEGTMKILANLKRSHSGIVLKDDQSDNTSVAEVVSLAPGFSNFKSSLRKSPLYGAYEVTREPANLQKFGPKTVETVFKKSVAQVVEPPEEELIFGKEVLRRLLSEFSELESEKSIVKGFANIAGLNKDSSNGFGCMTAKEYYIDFEQGEFTPVFRKELAALEDSIVNDDVEWLKLVWTEALKDEIRNTEKEGVPRSFRVSTIHQQVLTKKYSAQLVSQVMNQRLDNQVSIGCNPVAEWPIMYDKITKRNVFAGDIAKWDGAMVPAVQRAVNEVIMEKYKGKNSKVLSFLLDNLVNSLVIAGNKTYVMTHSMPSGSFLTAFYNSIVNRFYTAMWYKRLTPLAIVGEFNAQVLDYVYGDDKVVAVVPSRADLNAISMMEFFRSLGMDFTDALKRPITHEYDYLSEISFLKRTFSFHNKIQRIVCPLDLRTLFNTISWVDSKKNLDVVMEGKIDSVYRELFLHPNHEALMTEFQFKIEAMYPGRKWLKEEDLIDLYVERPNEFLIKTFAIQYE